MNPNLQYAQAVIGVSTGRSYGIIDTLHLVEVARAASLVRQWGMNAKGPRSNAGVVLSVSRRLTTSKLGQAERTRGIITRSAWALQVAEFARLAGNESLRGEVYRGYREIPAPGSGAADGSFRREPRGPSPIATRSSTSTYGGALPIPKDLDAGCKRALLSPRAWIGKSGRVYYPYIDDKSSWKWARDIEHFDALPVRSPGLLFAGLAFQSTALPGAVEEAESRPDRQGDRAQLSDPPASPVGMTAASNRRLPGVDCKNRGRSRLSVDDTSPSRLPRYSGLRSHLPVDPEAVACSAGCLQIQRRLQWPFRPIPARTTTQLSSRVIPIPRHKGIIVCAGIGQ